jgi:hypothetical protein
MMFLRGRIFVALTAIVGVGVAAVAASAASAPLTLKASPPSVAFSKNLVLSGTALHASNGETVHLMSQPCGFTSPAETQQVKTTAKGTFKFVFQPAITTTFSVTWGEQKSRKVHVVVRPMVELKRVSAGKYTVDVSAGAGSFFTGKKILLQRRKGKKWVKIAAARMKAKSSYTAVTAVSTANLTARVRSGWRVRSFLPGTSAGPCYGAASSAALH